MFYHNCFKKILIIEYPTSSTKCFSLTKRYENHQVVVFSSRNIKVIIFQNFSYFSTSALLKIFSLKMFSALLLLVYDIQMKCVYLNEKKEQSKGADNCCSVLMVLLSFSNYIHP